MKLMLVQYSLVVNDKYMHLDIYNLSLIIEYFSSGIRAILYDLPKTNFCQKITCDALYYLTIVYIII